MTFLVLFLDQQQPQRRKLKNKTSEPKVRWIETSTIRVTTPATDSSPQIIPTLTVTPQWDPIPATTMKSIQWCRRGRCHSVSTAGSGSPASTVRTSGAAATSRGCGRNIREFHPSRTTATTPKWTCRQLAASTRLCERSPKASTVCSKASQRRYQVTIRATWRMLRIWWSTDQCARPAAGATRRWIEPRSTEASPTPAPWAHPLEQPPRWQLEATYTPITIDIVTVDPSTQPLTHLTWSMTTLRSPLPDICMTATNDTMIRQPAIQHPLSVQLMAAAQLTATGGIRQRRHHHPNHHLRRHVGMWKKSHGWATSRSVHAPLNANASGRLRRPEPNACAIWKKAFMVNVTGPPLTPSTAEDSLRMTVEGGRKCERVSAWPN